MPFNAKTKVRGKPLSAQESANAEPEALTKLVTALADIQAGLEAGTYTMVTLGFVYKSDELQLGIRIGKSTWKNFEADNFVQALVNYAEELEA